jgi:hypothetical protein
MPAFTARLYLTAVAAFKVASYVVHVAKTKLTILVPADIADAARDAVVALSGPPLRLTLAQLGENALRAEIDRLRREHNKGKPFPSHRAALKGGRPIGSSGD